VIIERYVINVKTRRENVMPKFKDFVETTYTVPMIKREKYRKINPKTNREKNFKRMRQLVTKVAPEDRSFKNMPKYSTGKNKVSFQDWLLIKGEKTHPDHSVASIGKSEADGKWYGWSHRAVYGFKAGDKVTGDSIGKKVEYPKYTQSDIDAAKSAASKSGEATVIIPTVGELDFDNGKYEPDFTIKDDAHAREVAIRFAENVS
jgi:hypothetical protein